MVGIDIIDRTDSRLRIKTAAMFRFIRHEADNYALLPEDVNTRWYSIWSAKEAIFKVHRIDKPFDPTNIAIQFMQGSRGMIFKSNEIIGEMLITEHRIISIASLEGTAPIWSSFETELGRHQEDVRRQLYTYCLQHSLNNYKLTHSRLPELRDTKTGKKAIVSFSHHHKLGAFALSLPLH